MPSQPHYSRHDTSSWEDLPPTEKQISAIANQARCLGIPACVPDTRGAASAVISANCSAIAAKKESRRPVPPQVLETINRLEKKLGRHWLTGADTVNAPRTSSAAAGYIHELSQELSRNKEGRRQRD